MQGEAADLCPQAGQGSTLEPCSLLPGVWMLQEHNLHTPILSQAPSGDTEGAGQAAGTALHLPPPGLHRHSSARSHHTNSLSPEATKANLHSLPGDVRDVQKGGAGPRGLWFFLQLVRLVHSRLSIRSAMVELMLHSTFSPSHWV